MLPLPPHAAGPGTATVRGVDVALAVDVGGTKLAAALIDRAGSVLVRARVPTPDRAGAEVLWGALAELLSATVAQLPASRPVVVGVGCG